MLLLTDVDSEKLSDLASTLAADGAKVTHAVCDVSDRESVSAAFDTAEAQLGEVDILANVAGVGRFVPFADLTDRQWDRTFPVNTRGPFLTCQQLLRRRTGRPGAIVNLASIGARLGMDMLGDYGPSKAEVIELTHIVSRVGAPTGLRANTVLPGLIWTDMWEKTSDWLLANDPALAGSSAEQIFEGFVESMVPMRRPQTPKDIAEMAAFLLSERAANVTGQTISVDGGVVLT